MIETEFQSKYKVVDTDKELSEKVKWYIDKEYNGMKIIDVLYATKNDTSANARAYAKSVCMNCGAISYNDLYSISNGFVTSCGCKKITNAFMMSRNKIKESTVSLVGKEYKTNEGYTIKIISLVDTHNVLIRFMNVSEPYEVISTMQNIKNGQIKYPYHRNKYGGYYGVGPYTARIDGVKTRVYNNWIALIKRCNSKGNPNYEAYENVIVCEDWYNFQNFAKWYTENAYQCPINTSIDKDILSYYSTSDKKIYSPETCVIIPLSLNNMLKHIKTFKPEDILKTINLFASIIPKQTLNRIYDYYKEGSRSKTS